MRALGILAATRRTRGTAQCAVGEQAVSSSADECNAIAISKRITLHKLTPTDAEALQVVYDPTKIEYRSLLEFFYKMHDPTTENRQGPDVGTQYRSAIFYHDAEQEKIAKEVTQKVNEQWWKGGVTTEVLPAGEWWDAEAYHQKYLDANPGGYECPSHFLRSFPPLS